MFGNSDPVPLLSLARVMCSPLQRNFDRAPSLIHACSRNSAHFDSINPPPLPKPLPLIFSQILHGDLSLSISVSLSLFLLYSRFFVCIVVVVGTLSENFHDINSSSWPFFFFLFRRLIWCQFPERKSHTSTFSTIHVRQSHKTSDTYVRTFDDHLWHQRSQRT